MKIIFASSEVEPFSKTGGLADVAEALPAALARRGHEVTIITPRYRMVDVAAFDLRRKRCRLHITVKGKAVQGGILEGIAPTGVSVLFVDQSHYFDRDGIYGSEGKDFEDNDERYAFFCHAVLETCRLVGLAPDIIHCNDWQTGPIPALLQFEYRDRPELIASGTVFTVHNLGYQGLFPPESMMTLGLSWSLFTPSALEFFGKVSFIKAGLVFADKLTTVSKKYAEEILTPAFGNGLDKLLKERSAELRGILNGADYNKWDPGKDRLIAANYGPENPEGKAACKADLQQRMGLALQPSVPLIGWVSRLISQKGLDLFLQISEELLRLDCQWAFLGTGDPGLEKALQQLANDHPDKLSVRIGYDNQLAHRIYAGADILLMPSRYEPCGLNQMYSLRYGTIPVVRAVGGLHDTIEDVSEGEGNGFKFTQASPEALLHAVRRALQWFQDRPAWQELMVHAMNQDFSWDLPARRYETVYREVASLRKA